MLTLKAADPVVSQAMQLVASAGQEADTDPIDCWRWEGSACQSFAQSWVLSPVELV